MEFETPAGSICCVFASVITVRIEFDTWRTSVLAATTVVISVVGWSLYVSSSSARRRSRSRGGSTGPVPGASRSG